MSSDTAESHSQIEINYKFMIAALIETLLAERDGLNREEFRPSSTVVKTRSRPSGKAADTSVTQKQPTAPPKRKYQRRKTTTAVAQPK